MYWKANENANYWIYKNVQKATICQGASRVSNTALAQIAQPNLQGKCGYNYKNLGKRDLLDNDKKGNDV